MKSTECVNGDWTELNVCGGVLLWAFLEPREARGPLPATPAACCDLTGSYAAESQSPVVRYGPAAG